LERTDRRSWSIAKIVCSRSSETLASVEAKLMALHSQLDELINTMLPFVQQFHAKNQLAPHAAFINTDGELLGVAITDKDVSSDVEFSVLDAITHFELQFQKAAKANEIIASAIFFHGIGIIEPQKPAQTEEEAHTIEPI
jgi:hypothetical protein